MKGAVVRNAYYASLATRYQALRLRDTGRAMGLDMVVYDNDRPYTGSDLPDALADADFILFFDKDIKLAYALENAGKVLLNPARSVEIADDKALTAVYLEKYGLPTPKTVPSPKRYDKGIDEKYLSEVGRILGYPLVVKQNGGSLGEQVYLVRDERELYERDGVLSPVDRLYQEYVAESAGESYRAIVIGNKVFCAMKLTNLADFRSNAARGGEAEAVELPGAYVDLAETTAQKFGLNYVGVDLFCDRPSVIELNSNAYFYTAERVTKTNVARAILDEAIALVEKRK